jgi:hypothetical protein
MEQPKEIMIAGSDWQRLVEETQGPRRLGSGAIVKAGEDGIEFYATAASTPTDWQYPFTSSAPGGEPGALLGLATSKAGIVALEVCNAAAVAAVEADYDGQAGEVDDYTYEAAVNSAFAGTNADAEWLRERWFELVVALKS